MNFLGIGPFEILLVLVIATIVLGPERMAVAGRTLGRLYAQYRLRWQKDVDEMTRELRRELAMLQQEVEDIRQTAESEIQSAQAAFEDAVDLEDALDLKGALDVVAKDGDAEQASDSSSTGPAESEIQSAQAASEDAVAVEGELHVVAKDGDAEQASDSSSTELAEASETTAQAQQRTTTETEVDEVNE